MNESVKKLCIVGTGGFGRETLCCFLDSIGKIEGSLSSVVCFMESDENYVTSEVMGVPVINQSQFNAALYDVVIGIGDPVKRKLIAESLPANTTYRSVIHPSVVMSNWVNIGNGAVVTAGVILTCNITIGDHCHLNLHTTVGHDCTIGDYFTTSPAVNISGNCTFGECVYLGTNAAIKQGINICSNVIVGMGGTVVKNITESGTYIGTPVQKLIR